MSAKKEDIETDYDLNDYDYDGDEVLGEEKEDIEMEYSPEDFDEDEEEYDSDHDYRSD